MNKNTIVGLVLIFLLVIGYSLYNQQASSKQERLKQSEVMGHIMMMKLLELDELQESRLVTVKRVVEGDTSELAASTPDSLTIKEADSTAIFPSAIEGTESLIAVESDLLKVTFSNVGGKVSSVQVKGYKTFDHDSLVLFQDGFAKQTLSFLKDKEHWFTSDSLFFTTENQSTTVSGEEDVVVSYFLRNDSVSIEHRYTVAGNSHFVDYDIVMRNLNDVTHKQPALRLTWETKLNQIERDYDKAQDESEFIAMDIQDDISYIADASKKERAGDAGVAIKWFAHKHQFFASALVSRDSFTNVSTLTSEPDTADYFKSYSTDVSLPFDTTQELAEYNMRFFFGPLDYRDLKRDGLGMHRMIPMGSSILGSINRNVVYPVYRALNSVFGSVAINILLLAIFIKLVLTPLTFRSYKSQAKMKVLKPEIDELREKYGKDARRLQMETMKLYRKTGVSMFGGCIPMLLQFPVLIALYRFFPNVIDLRQASFLWVEDFSTYDSIANLPFSIPFYGDHISLLTILMAASSFLYSRTNPQQMSGSMGNQMKVLQYIFPFMLLFIFNSFPAGLTYYYFLYNMLTFGQQWAFKKWLIDEDAIRAKIEENKARPPKEGRMARFQKRLEAAQRSQMEARRNQKRR